MTADTLSARVARGLWTLYEPVHAVTYFAQEPRDAFAAVGLTDFMHGYFAGRSAPLGRANARVVTAAFASFAPSFVGSVVPAVWDIVSPATALDARSAGAARSIRRAVEAAGVTVSSELLDSMRDLAARLEFAGRTLAAANADVDVPADPVAALWQLTTVLREWRGDAHIAALVAEGLAGIDILVLRDTMDGNKTRMQSVRGWTDDRWSDAARDLTRRGLLDNGELTDAAKKALARVELATDCASELGTVDDMRSLAIELAPIGSACSALLRYPNPIGVTPVWDPSADPTAASLPVPYDVDDRDPM